MDDTQVRDKDGCFSTRPNIEAMREAKKARLRAILEFSRTEAFVTQKALAEWLAERGLGCNQSQLAKDLAQLGLAAYVDRGGTRRLGRRTSIISEQLQERYVKIFQEAVLGGESFNCYVILKTVPGCAQAVATVVETAGWTEVKSVFCGIDCVTILCVNEQCADIIFDRTREGYL